MTANTEERPLEETKDQSRAEDERENMVGGHELGKDEAETEDVEIGAKPERDWHEPTN
jgi:hypothetical protein